MPENEEIDLLNIAFEKQKPSVPNKKNNHKKAKKLSTPDEASQVPDEELMKNLNLGACDDLDYLVPDRISGIESLKELNPNRKWNFVEINVNLDELKTERESLIKNLLYPHVTVLDDSIGCALWFASRGHGHIRKSEQTKEEYKSNAEVLLLGRLKYLIFFKFIYISFFLYLYWLLFY
jgi:hypothetical protein